MSTVSSSIIISIFPDKSFITWLALVGLGFPDVLALGAAIYTPDVLISSAATLWLGILIATVPRPPVIESGTMSDFFNIIVNGPGQNLSASFNALSGTSQDSLYKASISAI